MKIKEYNRLRRSLFDSVMEFPEIAEAVKSSGYVSVYDLFQLPDKHMVMVSSGGFTHDFLQQHGFDPNLVVIRNLFSVDRQTKTVSFHGAIFAEPVAEPDRESRLRPGCYVALNPFSIVDYLVQGENAKEAAKELEESLDRILRLPYSSDFDLRIEVEEYPKIIAEKYNVKIGTTLDK